MRNDGNSGSSARRLLILGCSSRKHNPGREVRAWDLYDGVFYRMLKKREREGRLPATLDIRIISARHGLIAPSQRIAWYDQRMTRGIACRQLRSNRIKLRRIFARCEYAEVVFCAGAEYAAAIQISRAQPVLAVIGGRIGQKLHNLGAWLDQIR